MHHRRSLRLPDHDYASAGWYFITILSYHRQRWLCDIVDGGIVLSDKGGIVERCWLQLPQQFSHIELDAYVIMPDHFHGIVRVVGDRQGGEGVGGNHGTKPGSVGAIVQSFKSVSTRRVNAASGTRGGHLWHRNYYESVIRSERRLAIVREYVRNNPRRWQETCSR